jgi:hypothetical protein
MNQSARRMNALASQLSARRYLEIGVQNGTTFRDVEISERTGVDPDFKFDTNAQANESTRFIQKRSDQFFAHEPICPPYDLIFIDGLHVFEQVLRDFSNSLIRTHKRSVIILDDTLPNDVFSSLNTYAAAIRHRKEAGKTNGEWHGDVFKTIFYIHDFWPSLNYRTITGSGNPQTLVWRANGINRTPLFNNLERISRMSWFDLRDNIQVMQMTTEEEAISLCIAEINAL